MLYYYIYLQNILDIIIGILFACPIYSTLVEGNNLYVGG